MVGNTNKHWYDLNPSRLEMEKMAMATLFPEFNFFMINDGDIRYSGTLKSDKFIRPEGYSVIVEYDDGGIENFGNPGIVISPTSPDFDDLFPASNAYTEELQRELLNQVAIDMKCVVYEDPATAQTTTINTAASLLKKAIDWFVRYEEGKKRLEQQEIEPMDDAALRRQELRKKINGCPIKPGCEESVSNDICDIIIPIADHNLNKYIATDSGEKPICPSYIDEWYDTYPGLYKIRLSFLHQFFPQFEAKIQRGSLTGLCSGNIILLCGNISFGTKNNHDEIISFDIEIRIRGYWSRTKISTSEQNLAYISSKIGYTPSPFESGWFKEYSSSISTLFDTVMNTYEWLSLLDCGLNGQLDRCFFHDSTKNVPKQNNIGADKDSDFYTFESSVLDEGTYRYQTFVSRKRRELRMCRDPYRLVKLK